MRRSEPPTASPVDVDVIIVSYNGQDHLDRAMTSLAASRGVDVHLIVVDNGSADESVSTARRLGARVFELGANRGYGAAANVGLANAAAPWTLVCNQDVVAQPDALAVLIAAAMGEEQTCRQPAIVSPGLVGADGALAETGHRLPSLGNELMALLGGDDRFRRLSVVAATSSPQHSSPQHCDWVSGAFLVARRATWQALGGFDPAYFMYMEDVDLFDRLRAMGGHCLWVPEARVVHLGGRRPISAALFCQGLRNRQHYWRQRRGALAGSLVWAAAVTGSSARSIKWTLRSLRGDDEARAYARMFRRAAWLCTRPPGASRPPGPPGLHEASRARQATP